MVLIFMMAVMMLAVIAIAPRVAQQTKRDREEEMIHRGAQYARAIQRYFRKFGRYPSSIEQLENTNNVRYLRKRYADPMVEDGKWKFLHPGDVKVGGANVGTPVSAMASGTQQPTGLTGTNPATSLTGGTYTRPTTTTGGAANTQIGGFIIGVSSVSEAVGIHEFDKKDHYNEWYFVYDLRLEQSGGTGVTVAAPMAPGSAGSAGGANGQAPAAGPAPGQTPAAGNPPSGTPPTPPQQPN